MQTVERMCRAFRHSSQLRNAGWLWDGLRGPYLALLGTVAPHGLERVINGSDVIRVLPECRSIPEDYERDVWSCLMDEARPGDVVADVGANVGLYTIAFAKRVGADGMVYAFEPDPANFRPLEKQCRLNQITKRVRLYEAAVADSDGHVTFEVGFGSESHIGNGTAGVQVRSVCLDSVFAAGRLDILKIDVEGFEEVVLKGASQLLDDETRSPRFIYIEVHPYAWRGPRTTSESLLALLAQKGYAVLDLSGRAVTRIEAYGGVLARRRHS